ncbi:MAG: hypothetical protein IKF39_11330 [Oscillospiraceae bacterium]|nr:hypothetical protein [Oscillospiraceae bacterium]
MIRIIPNIPKIKAHWERRSDDIPTYLEVPMSNGTIVKYIPEIVQPGFVAAMENIKNMTVGYPIKNE